LYEPLVQDLQQDSLVALIRLANPLHELLQPGQQLSVVRKVITEVLAQPVAEYVDDILAYRLLVLALVALEKLAFDDAPTGVLLQSGLAQRQIRHVVALHEQVEELG